MAVKTQPTTITLKEQPVLKEGQASSAINPGHLVEYGGAKELQAQSTAGQDCRRAFALEDDLIGNSVTDAYAADSNVRYGVFNSGAEVLGRVAAAAPAIAKYDQLEATGDGTLRKITTGTAIAVALEAVDNSGGGSEVFIQVEVL